MMFFLKFKRSIFFAGGLIFCCLTLVACSSNKKAECETVLETVYATEEQLEMGVQTKDALNTNAEHYQALAVELSELELQHKTLQEPVENLAAAFDEHAESWLATAQITASDGTIRGEEAYRKSAARELRSQNKIQLSTDRLMAACR